jgi:hypothetical protein
LEQIDQLVMVRTKPHVAMKPERGKTESKPLSV